MRKTEAYTPSRRREAATRCVSVARACARVYACAIALEPDEKKTIANETHAAPINASSREVYRYYVSHPTTTPFLAHTPLPEGKKTPSEAPGANTLLLIGSRQGDD